jgi:hypothetical protein
MRDSSQLKGLGEVSANSNFDEVPNNFIGGIPNTSRGVSRNESINEVLN